jgi:hypothetical protein
MKARGDMTMNRRFASALLVAVGMLLGFASSSLQRNELVPAARAADVGDPQDREVVAQLKEINAQLKDIGALLHSNKLRVVNVINPDVP